MFVDDVFRMPGAFNTGTVILGTVSYSLQIHLDFSGYSDMAVGVSHMLGFDMAANFYLPLYSGECLRFLEQMAYKS